MSSASAGENELSHVGWLRAAVLGANDGIVSTSSLILGVAAANASHGSILVSGTAALFAGAMSMATGEYVSVQSQADSERAALKRECEKLKQDPTSEQLELAQIYVRRGLDRPLAIEVSRQLMAHDPLGAHARDDLGLSETLTARPIQAALASALSFSAGALLPLLVVLLAPHSHLIPVIVVASLILLAALGGLAARVGGSPIGASVLRVTLWSALAMAVTSGIGMLFGTTG